ncbi:hypothetical protein ACGFYU_10465 [Streptomyces sp. NPDC048337]|uniref:hypothetical protein n=1 Tax=Streptomyces sp. NPDC048337 TaxID=3365535 RepID=UPI003719376E
MTGLVLEAAAAVRSPEGPGPAPADSERAATIRAFHHDLLGPFGAKADEELLAGGAHVSHRQLADLLAEADGVREARPQLLIVTHALPDVVPFTAVSPHLTGRLGGEATNFAIGQQGLAAPFTALRIAAAYQRSGRAAEVVLAVLEQTTLPTALPLVRETPLIDSAAALVLRAGERTGPGTGLRLAGVRSGPFDAEAEDEGTLLVLGPWAARGTAAGRADVHRTPGDTYCTGVWLELALHRERWQRSYRRVVLSDTDPLTGRSHHAVFTTAEADGR